MGTCSGKKTFVSQPGDVNVEFRSKPSQSRGSRPGHTSKVRPVQVVPAAHLGDRTDTGPENLDTSYQHPDIVPDQSDIKADIQNTEDDGVDLDDAESLQMVRELNKKNNAFSRTSEQQREICKNEARFKMRPVHLTTLPGDTELIEQTIDEVYEHVLNSNLLHEKEAEILEVIREDEEFDMDNDNISLVESEVIDEIASHLEDKPHENGDSENVKADSSKTAKGKSGKCVKRSDSKESVKSEKKKKDKQKDKNKDRLWTSRSTAVKWRQEKVYTTLGKDGTLFKIRILRKPTKDESDKAVQKGERLP